MTKTEKLKPVKNYDEFVADQVKEREEAKAERRAFWEKNNTAVLGESNEPRECPCGEGFVLAEDMSGKFSYQCQKHDAGDPVKRVRTRVGMREL